ncbi:nuclear movement protein, putative [Leishmania guyanensis]|uniref:Nuclear movement protein, putative,NUDC-like protein n=1 Tax=Leishmania guyanensis TaxID=5670 RepID=A0A1E1J1L7_LEIGU|nr:nuclear movement protein, putative,NUDC-like protein [Leishmania guyanensis]
MSLVGSQEGLTDLIPCNEQCGGDYTLYTFGQSEKEVTITVPLAPGTRGKSLCVDIKPKYLQIEVPSKGTILAGELYKPISVHDSTWCIQDGRELVVVLAKTNIQYEEWWPHVVTGERQIDFKTLKPPSIRFSDLDSGAQATVAKMMHEQHQKREDNRLANA